MYTLDMLCRDIGLAEEVTNAVLALDRQLDSALHPAMEMLCRESDWEQGLTQLTQQLGDDPRGFKLLTCMLRCALRCHAEFKQLGLSQRIYIDTFRCFTRFTNEHRVSFGRYGFDRGFWTVRQVSCKLFRIGQLEYELLTENGKKLISLHIPSDADLRLPLLRASYEEAKALIDKTFPDFANVPYVCGSWLFSPQLKALLPEDSRILAFQRSFEIQKTYEEKDYIEWVYKNSKAPLEQLPEDTSLQRSLKTFLLAGGKFYNGEGQLVSDPFQEK